MNGASRDRQSSSFPERPSRRTEKKRQKRFFVRHRRALGGDETRSEPRARRPGARGRGRRRVSIGSRDRRYRVVVDRETYLVVVEVVVLDVPSLGHHPVHPVGDTAREALGEGAPVEAARHDAVLGLRGVVAAVAHVVADHGPARADRGGHAERRDGVDAADGVERVGQEGGGEQDREPAEVEGVGPRQDLVQVLDVILVDVRLELLLHGADLGGPSREVEGLAPLAGLVVRHGRAGVGHRDRGAHLDGAARGGGGRHLAGDGRATAHHLGEARGRERHGRGEGHGGHDQLEAWGRWKRDA